jgi:2'-5' RNA ligase
MINSTLSAYCQKRQSFQVIQNGLGAFEPRVIFVNVEESEALADLQRELLKTMRMELKLDSTNYKNQGFHPHMTIAFRDLKKSIFPEAWNHFKNKSINKTWPAEVIHLLKHKGQHWEVFKSFALQKEVRTLSLPN